MTLVATLWLGCTQPPDEPADMAAADTEAPDTAGPGPATVHVDVLVVGSGPAGSAAAWRAREDGASVLVLEREARAGGAGWYAGNFYAVGTRHQSEAGIDDSIAQATEEWADATGGDGNDPWVQALFERSEAVVSWLVDDLGAEFNGFAENSTAGTTTRLHRLALPGSSLAPVALVTEPLEDVIWLEHEATGLVTEGDRVAGASYTDLRTDESGWVQAGSVVVATGGFARNREAVVEARPALLDLGLSFESAPSSDGGGEVLLASVPAQRQNLDAVGVYVHSLADPRDGFDDEVLWPSPSVKKTLIVDLDGQRVADESLSMGFGMVDVLLEAPDQRLFALLSDGLYDNLSAQVPAYNRSDEEAEETVDLAALVEAGVLSSHADAAEVAAWWGLDPEALSATVARYDALAASGEDLDFGKDPSWMIGFGDRPIHTLELVPGVAKTFGGLLLDDHAQVLDHNGEPIQGLYAAGEVAGMLGTSAIGSGLDGTVTACYLTGLVAGEHAAAAR